MNNTENKNLGFLFNNTNNKIKQYNCNFATNNSKPKSKSNNINQTDSIQLKLTEIIGWNSRSSMVILKLVESILCFSFSF